MKRFIEEIETAWVEYSKYSLQCDRRDFRKILKGKTVGNAGAGPVVLGVSDCGGLGDLERVMSVWCKHYNGRIDIHSDEPTDARTCRVGVRYADVETEAPKLINRKLPCTNPALGERCPKAEYPTPEEVEREEQELKTFMAYCEIAREDIHCKLGGEPGNCVVECPKCEGELHGSMAYNGHIWGACQTKGCLRWME